MNYEKSVKVLNLKEPFVKKDIKKSYYSLAVKYHPDKHPDSNVKFLEIKEAYDFLLNYLKLEKEEDCDDYIELIKKCIKLISPNINWSNLFMDTTFKSIINDCQNLSLKFFKELNKEKSIEIYSFLCTYKNIFNIKSDVLGKMSEIIKEKRKNDNLIILNPSFDDLFNEIVYILEICDKKFYIPLWSDEIHYDVSGDDLIVKCIPNIDDTITIDSDNNIFISLNLEITHTLVNDIKFTLGSKIFNIPSSQLKILPKQTYCLYNK